VGDQWVTGRSLRRFFRTQDAHGICSAEAAIALRQRLNESIDELDMLRKEHAELQVKFNSHDRELTIAKSDCESIHASGPR
jgi:hypothetical protein